MNQINVELEDIKTKLKSEKKTTRTYKLFNMKCIIQIYTIRIKYIV